MKLNETDLTLIRVRLVIRDGDGVLVDNVGALSAGDLVTSANGAGLVNALGTLVRIGGGFYYYQGTVMDAQTEGFLMVVFKKAGYRVESNWVPVVGTNGQIKFPFALYDDGGGLVAGVTPSVGELQDSVNGASWTSPATGTWTQIGLGFYCYAHDVVNQKGFVGVQFARVGIQTMIAWGSIDVVVANEVVLPVITIMSPPPGAAIGQSTALTFRYTDNLGIRRALPAIKFLGANGYYHYELVHDGDNFTPDYSGVRTPISGGYEYTVTRRNGWGATLTHSGGSPQLVPFGVDASGNEPA